MTEREVFLAALAINDPVVRQRFIEERFPHDEPARERVLELLQAVGKVGDFLEKPAAEATGAYQAPDTVGRIGAIIAGKYKLREKLGEGGMGSVWVADQSEPVQRRVAIKLIKTGSDSRSVLARFEQERQALALMDHPNIAKVFDAGVDAPVAHAPGSPYFVMELIKGVPLTKYCDDAKLSTEQRLELFIPVCQAVQHAHQKGIIHRDLKPSNVLVGLYDGKPVPKVIDFGVAKATGSRLTDESIYTEVGSLVGTLEYMSPEQAELNNLDIDTRTDVYALGVMLYELLTGSVPFSRKELAKAGLGEMLRVIKEVEPPKPSTKLSGSGNLPSIAANRHTEPARLTRLLKGDLDWIVMKALEKDRSRRYETANGFAADVQRHLAGEPVIAAPPSTAYRLKKLVKRNKGKVIAAGLVALTFLAGITGTTWGLVAARQSAEAERVAKDDAVAAAEKERLAKDQAQKRLAQIEKGNEIITSIFIDLDIRRLKEGTDPLAAVLAKRLEKAAEQLEGEAVGDPLVVAELQHRLGRSLHNLGHVEAAITVLEKATTTRVAGLGADQPETLASMNSLALGYKDAGQFDRALPLLEETLRLRMAKLGAGHRDTHASMSHLALGYQATGQFDRALPHFQEALRFMKANLGTDHPDTLQCMNNLAFGYHAAGQFDRALPLLEETLRLRKARLGADHADTLISMNNLAAGYHSAGQFDRAVPLLEETLRLMKVKLGADHPDTLQCMNNLANTYKAAGEPELALPLHEETLRLRKVKLGADHPDTLNSMNNLATSYQDAGQLDRALPLHEETLRLRSAKLGADHPDTLASMNNLATSYQDAGQLDRALPLLEETLRIIKGRLGIDHPHTLGCISNLAGAYLAAEQLDQALPLFEDAAAGVEKREFRHEHAGIIIANVIKVYQQAKQFDKAEAWRRKWLAHVQSQVGTNHSAYAGELAELGLLLLKQKKWSEAETTLKECLSIREKTQPDDWTTFNTMSMLGSALLGQKKYADTEPHLVRDEGLRRASERKPDVDATDEKTRRADAATLAQRLTEALQRLVELYDAWGKPVEAEKWRLRLEEAKASTGK